MDINLKGELDGIETASIISDKHDIPIIYMTAYSADEVLNRAMETEPFAYLVKPARESELRSNIQMALYKHAMESERKAMMEQIKRQVEQIKVLSGLLPICFHCKSIRDDDGYWSNLDWDRALSKGQETAEKVAEAMKKVYAQTGVDFDIHVSPINSVGIKKI